ncbi:MAG: periplasmic heavy metal sensor, partial [Bacteroidota bacterium]
NPMPTKFIQLILSVAVVVLLLVNLTTLASIWPYIDLQHFTFTPPSPENPKAFIFNKLNLDKEQQKVFEELRKEHFEEMKTLQASILDEKESMYEQLKSNLPDTVATYGHMARIMQQEEHLERITLEHFRKLRAICTDEQKQHFDVIIDKIMHMVNKNSRNKNMPAQHSPDQPLP